MRQSRIDTSIFKPGFNRNIRKPYGSIFVLSYIFRYIPDGFRKIRIHSVFLIQTLQNRKVFSFHMQALERSRSLEEIAHREVSGTRNPHHRAEALDRWMRKSIRYDTKKYNDLLACGHTTSYRNSIQTFNDTQGICGEQALLYIVLCRYAGLDARFLIKQDPSHAMSRVITPAGILDVDHTDPYGFDRPAGDQYREVSDHEVEQLYKTWNAAKIPADNYQDQLSDTMLSDTMGDTTSYQTSYSFQNFGGLFSPFVPTSFTKCVAIAMFAWMMNSHTNSICSRLGSFLLPHATSIAVPNEYAIPYTGPALEILQSTYGTKAPLILEELSTDFDDNADHILDRFEAHTLYCHVLLHEEKK